MISLGTVVRDKVTGFTGVAENRATYIFGCDRYCVQPRVGEDGKMPEDRMIDEPQLEIIEDGVQVMKPIGEPEMRVKFGQMVSDPIRGLSGTVTGRAVYLNGCSRVLIEPKQTPGGREVKSWWVDEGQVVLLEEKTCEPDRSVRRTGGPARSSSKH